MNLENRLFYRLVKVTYICFITAFFLWMLGCGYKSWQMEVDLGVTRKDFIIWMLSKEMLSQIAVFTVIIFPFYYSFLNIIKETLLYIAFGQNFTWSWLLPVKHIFQKSIKAFKNN